MVSPKVKVNHESRSGRSSPMDVDKRDRLRSSPMGSFCLPFRSANGEASDRLKQQQVTRYRTVAFWEIRAAALAQLPDDTGLDGELVVWEAGRLAFERLQQRLARRRGAGALAAAQTWPAHLVSCSTSCTWTAPT
ncbi:hypothetical protein [Streptomyces sp. CA-251251]|uniref:hypothetical protein n=1 Tax=Streptomyces sp. CA-251251 TaxID=3240063 RepID=UPI003D8E9DA4